MRVTIDRSGFYSIRPGPNGEILVKFLGEGSVLEFPEGSAVLRLGDAQEAVTLLTRIAGALERAADALETLARIAEERDEGESLEAATAAYDTKKRT